MKSGTQFTCLTRTKVQIRSSVSDDDMKEIRNEVKLLSLLALLVQKYKY